MDLDVIRRVCDRNALWLGRHGSNAQQGQRCQGNPGSHMPAGFSGAINVTAKAKIIPSLGKNMAKLALAILVLLGFVPTPIVDAHANVCATAVPANASAALPPEFPVTGPFTTHLGGVCAGSINNVIGSTPSCVAGTITFTDGQFCGPMVPGGSKWNCAATTGSVAVINIVVGFDTLMPFMMETCCLPPVSEPIMVADSTPTQTQSLLLHLAVQAIFHNSSCIQSRNRLA
jgi:hypothetical protein